jgi:MtrB/PioB family decaheme-associated outer membrane protein
MTSSRQHGWSSTFCAGALLAFLAPAWAEDDAVARLAKPDTASVSAGGAGISGDPKDRSLFTQYNGLHKDDAYFLLDFDYIVRDDATGTWTIVQGRDLGLDTREVRFLYGPQGKWQVHGEYWELTRYYPRTVDTSVQGIGTTNLAVSLLPAPGTGQDADLKTNRKRLNVGGETWFGKNLMLAATFTTEDKDGARLWGRGFTCPSGAAPTPVCTALATGANQWALLMLPEPIGSNTKQVEVKLNWSGERFNLVGGYYGSFYNNDYASLTDTITGNLNNGLGVPMSSPALTPGLRGILQLPMALPPDNQAHQFNLDGSYAFTTTTHANFKYAYTHATQTQSFSQGGFDSPPPGRGDLGGRVDTNLVQAAINSRPWSRLALLANVRWEDRKDKTPIDLYNIEGTTTWTNGHYSNEKLTGKAEATYSFPYGIRGSAGLDYESVDRGQFVPTDQVAGLSGLRQKTYDRGWHLAATKTMADDVTGMITYVHTDRKGSSWLKPASGTATGVFPADPDCTSNATNPCIFSRTAIFPYVMEDRRRDKVRALVDWSPIEKLSVQLSGDYGKDNYSGPTEKGLDHTRLELYGIDVSYRVNDTTRLSAYYTYSEQTLKVAHSTGYIADLKDRNDTAGLGIAGVLNPRIRWGGDLLWIKDNNQYNTSLDSGASAQNLAYFNSGLPFIPDATFRDFRIKLYGSYAVQRNGDIKLEVVHDRTKLDEWQWGYNGVPFLYSDNTTVNLKPDQSVTFVSVLYTYRFK